MSLGAPDSKLADIIIVNWNGRSLLERCLRSVEELSLGKPEIIVIDNGSTDGSPAMVRELFAHTRLIELTENVGFARANNIAIRETNRPYVALLNNDAQVRSGWLTELINVLATHQQFGMCAPKILLEQEPSLADACGDFYTIDGIAGKTGHQQPANKFDSPREVFGASAAAVLYRRSMLQEIGLFDEDFFITHEDTDLSFRAQLMNYKCAYVPSSIVHHRVGATISNTGHFQTYHAQRNMEFVYIKNMPTRLILKYWHLHILTDIILLIAYASRGQLRTALKAKFDAIGMMSSMLKKRAEIQRSRRVSDEYIDSILTKGWLRKKTVGRLKSIIPGPSTPHHDHT